MAPTVKDFINDFIKLTGEITTLHGRHELSRDGYILMKRLIRDGMMALSEEAKPKGGDLVKAKKYEAGSFEGIDRSVDDSRYWHGYRKSDVISFLSERFPDTVFTFTSATSHREESIWCATTRSQKGWLLWHRSPVEQARTLVHYGLVPSQKQEG